jgi:DNA segregation ATPase FtsK/SpoIIIE-like protein
MTIFGILSSYGACLKWAVEEMERRYKLFAHYHVRNITAFNKKAPYDYEYHMLSLFEQF